MLAQSIPISYHTEAFAKTEVVCTVHFPFTILGGRIVKNLKEMINSIIYYCKSLSGWVVKNSLKTSNVMQFFLVETDSKKIILTKKIYH